MSTMIAEVYDAFIEAGASKAQAAIAVADYDGRFDRIDVKLAGIEGEMAVLRAELAMVKWIVGGVGFGTVLLVIRSFWPT